MSGFFNGASGRLAFIAALWALALLTPGSRPSAQGNLGRCVRGIQMLEFNTYDQAIHFCSTVIDQGLIPDDTMFRVLAERGRSYRRKGLEERVEADYAQALAVAGELFNQALISNPKSAFVHLYLGVLYGDQGRHGEAVEQLSEVIRIQPGRSLAHYNRGLSYIFLEQYAAARRDFDQAAELDPDFAATYYNRGLARNGICRITTAPSRTTAKPWRWRPNTPMPTTTGVSPGKPLARMNWRYGTSSPPTGSSPTTSDFSTSLWN